MEITKHSDLTTLRATLYPWFLYLPTYKYREASYTGGKLLSISPSWLITAQSQYINQCFISESSEFQEAARSATGMTDKSQKANFEVTPKKIKGGGERKLPTKYVNDLLEETDEKETDEIKKKEADFRKREARIEDSKR